MDILEHRYIKRLQDAIGALNSACVAIESCTISALGPDGYRAITDDEEATLAAACGDVLATYVNALCSNCDYGEKPTRETIEDTIESQIIVESDCLKILSRRLSHALLNDNHSCLANAKSLGKQLLINSQIAKLMEYKPCHRALEFLCDQLIIDSGPVIYLESHGETILQKTCNACMAESSLMKQSHICYIQKYLTAHGDAKRIDLYYLNCSEPWIVYWTLHSLCILGADISLYKQRALATLENCWDARNGGYGGGHGQIAHLATTYAALCVYKMLNCLDRVNVGAIYGFLTSMKLENGCFTVHKYGEYDVRGIYCAIASASMLNILTPELQHNVAEHISKCQTYEGGIAGELNLEAHAGYTYCAVAALALMDRLDVINVEKLKSWCHSLQTNQFGYQGRTHKLVDACYSFWVGATIDILTGAWGTCLNAQLLKVYLYTFSQMQQGFRDKPNVQPDLYHTCYALSALLVLSRHSVCEGDDFYKIRATDIYNVLINVIHY
ncbi:bifunctional Protein farnesyltransferase subunit beta/Terpenoid cyclases-protein prenyltransferase alpha-alpha toroid/PFTB repeat/Prenyltransferase subunit beta [Babesia duncani]|uniref:Bifunctional Protein farnesyltransferase subunit beta/Terpenoid cyclases-protein prenyltransferase alpha-alpha toroid/PFTB repeat/Prenyltransferase subunit beta n=1 Tax=Babesia duncani TaxID=323732 RepID=A0AAD9PH80_9APIC|nr:bifunctional Protein farnesyltransferase subunit beta/Terpenoid cyclases-protein prenyltransferase alpha-alpha toroid/PFTB repeat/Prenyltransferase subunit beta [Babesia duncani]KAK2197908.1 bifunctional Protein farnesyltransferase subunit beta/Terpenoid cyclases-protein prenyltransferase alpha-alpha toroid/PFTB repeat/Prenyltransferase subunit beta [Babesia duncani]